MEITLGGKNGGTTIVSKKDYPLLSQYSWRMNSGGYVSASIKGKGILMHRLVMDAKKEEVVDHINHIRHDNRRKNLRITDSMKNAQNRKRLENTISQYRGVTFNKHVKKYRTQITINHIHYSLGYYDNEIDAAESIDMFIAHNKYDHIQLNFPGKRENYLIRPYIPYTKTHILNCIYDEGNYFRARLFINGKHLQIAKSKNLTYCAKKMDKYIVEHKILNRKLNFPEDYPDYNNKSIKIKCKKVDDTTVKLVLPKYPDKEVFVSKQDYDKIKYYSWYVNKLGYVIARVEGKCTKLHRFLLEVKDPKVLVDHIDGNKQNNTRENLRISDHSKNAHNRTKKENTTSKYIGVRFIKNLWSSRLTFNNISTAIAYDKKESHAGRRRDLFILDHFPNEHYKMNFEWDEASISFWKNKLGIKSDKETISHYMKQILTALNDNNFKKLEKYHLLFTAKINTQRLEPL